MNSLAIRLQQFSCIQMNSFSILNKVITPEESSEEETCPLQHGTGACLPVSGGIRFKSHLTDEEIEFSGFLSQKSTRTISHTKRLFFLLPAAL